MSIPSVVQQYVNDHSYPLVFATLSGAHLYGFPSPDSDYDIRGSHVLPLPDVVGLTTSNETVDRTQVIDGVEVDIVTHDFRMFCNLLLRKNGNVLEQIFSPIVLHTTPEHEELKAIAQNCITRHHIYHYAGFAHTKWKHVQSAETVQVKPLLYLFRVLLTGIHLLRTGKVEANLLHLNEDAKLPYIADLVQQKQTGPEKGAAATANMAFFESEYERLRAEMTQASEESHLPEHPSGEPALNDLLIRLRMKTTHSE
jgi:predicted nucleotidyltransferase